MPPCLATKAQPCLAEDLLVERLGAELLVAFVGAPQGGREGADRTDLAHADLGLSGAADERGTARLGAAEGVEGGHRPGPQTELDTLWHLPFKGKMKETWPFSSMNVVNP